MKLSNLLNSISIILGIVGIWLFFKKSDFVTINAAEIDPNTVNPTTKGGTPSGKSKGEIQAITESVYQTMCDFGTDEKELFAQLELLSKADLIAVYNAFQKRRYLAGAWAGFAGEDLNLFGWFRAELSKPDITRMNSIWAKTGLKI